MRAQQEPNAKTQTASYGAPMAGEGRCQKISKMEYIIMLEAHTKMAAAWRVWRAAVLYAPGGMAGAATPSRYIREENAPKPHSENATARNSSVELTLLFARLFVC